MEWTEAVGWLPDRTPATWAEHLPYRLALVFAEGSPRWRPARETEQARTSPGAACDITRAPTCTVTPQSFLPSTSACPTWHPVRSSKPSLLTSSETAHAHLIASTSSGNVAKKPSPALSISFLIPLEALPDDGVVPGEQNAPTTFPKRRREPGRVDDVVNRTVARTCSRRRTSLECAPPVPGAQTDPSRGRGENGRDRSSTDRADSDFKDGTRHVIGG